MGKIKYLKDFRDHFKARSYFSVRDAELFLRAYGADKNYVRLMLHQMEKRGEIKRLKRGYYSFSDNLDTVGFIFEPFYYGLQEALSMHGLWGQQTNPVIITTRKVRTGLRSILGKNVLVRHINKKMFFGYEFKIVGNAFLPVSEIEKTLIDFAYFKLAMPDYALRELLKKLNKEKLDRYLTKVNNPLKDRVIRLLSPVA